MSKRAASSEQLPPGKGFPDRLLTVDPGWDTGWALWHGDAHPVTGAIREQRGRKVLGTADRLEAMVREFNALLGLTKPEVMGIEVLERHGGTAGSAAMDAGDLFVVGYLIGGYTYAAQRLDIDVVFRKRSEWGGQLSKSMVAGRVLTATGNTYPNDHITDAVGIGLAMGGIL